MVKYIPIFFLISCSTTSEKTENCSVFTNSNDNVNKKFELNLTLIYDNEILAVKPIICDEEIKNLPITGLRNNNSFYKKILKSRDMSSDVNRYGIKTKFDATLLYSHGGWYEGPYLRLSKVYNFKIIEANEAYQIAFEDPPKLHNPH